MSDTPRTDALFAKIGEPSPNNQWDSNVAYELRQLERELAVCRAVTSLCCEKAAGVAPEAAHGLDEDGLQLLRDARTALDHSYDVQSYPANGKTNQDACIREIDAYLAKQLPQGD